MVDFSRWHIYIRWHVHTVATTLMDDSLFAAYNQAQYKGGSHTYEEATSDLYLAYFQARSKHPNPTNTADLYKHVVDSVHAIFSPTTYLIKSVSDGTGAGIEVAIETGTREITGSFGKVIEHTIGPGLKLGVAVVVIALLVSLAWHFVFAARAVFARAVFAKTPVSTVELRLVKVEAELVAAQTKQRLAETALEQLLIEQADSVHHAPSPSWLDYLSVQEACLVLETSDACNAGSPRKRGVALLMRDMGKHEVPGTADRVYALVKTNANKEQFRTEVSALLHHR